MIINDASTQAVCSLGWVHKGSLWVYTIEDSYPHTFELSDAKFLTVRAGKSDFFSVVHHWEGDKLEITAHNHSEPHRPVSCISFHREGFGRNKIKTTVSGDNSVWQELPRAYVAQAFDDFHLFLVSRLGDASIQVFNWYADSRYNKMYQGIVGVEELPNSHLLIVSVQRDSNPILYDPDSEKEIRKLTLAGRNGNPQLRFRNSANELWADDYDHIVKLDATTLNVIASKQLQEATEGTGHFIGGFSFDRGERLCLVARPFSGDVIGLDCDSMRQTHRAEMGKQPLNAGLLGDDTIVALDWKTGELVKGKLERV